MGEDACYVAKSDGPGPSKMVHECVMVVHHAHQDDTSCRADGYETATDTCAERDEHPLAARHVRVHGEDGEHQWNIVERRAKQADRNVGGCRAQIAVKIVRHQPEIASDPKPTDSKNDAEE